MLYKSSIKSYLHSSHEALSLVFGDSWDDKFDLGTQISLEIFWAHEHNLRPLSDPEPLEGTKLNKWHGRISN